MNDKQKERLKELKEKAIDEYLNNTDFDITDYIDEKDGKEYCELENMLFTEKNCLCSKHTDWQ